MKKLINQGFGLPRQKGTKYLMFPHTTHVECVVWIYRVNT